MMSNLRSSISWYAHVVWRQFASILELRYMVVVLARDLSSSTRGLARLARRCIKAYLTCLRSALRRVFPAGLR